MTSAVTPLDLTTKATSFTTIPTCCTTTTAFTTIATRFSTTNEIARRGNSGGASMFEANVIPMMTFLQFLFFALAPMVAVVIAFMGAQGAGIYMKYVMFGIWTQSWLPVVAIINDYAQLILVMVPRMISIVPVKTYQKCANTPRASLIWQVLVISRCRAQ
ncbi:conjugal transfer protein TraG [Acidithiobacillus ferrivorans]|nr:conjugal transfer protein TraG [Acidithiobacillus ferrivorans]